MIFCANVKILEGFKALFHVLSVANSPPFNCTQVTFYNSEIFLYQIYDQRALQRLIISCFHIPSVEKTHQKTLSLSHYLDLVLSRHIRKTYRGFTFLKSVDILLMGDCQKICFLLS